MLFISLGCDYKSKTKFHRRKCLPRRISSVQRSKSTLLTPRFPASTNLRANSCHSWLVAAFVSFVSLCALLFKLRKNSPSSTVRRFKELKELKEIKERYASSLPSRRGITCTVKFWQRTITGAGERRKVGCATPCAPFHFAPSCPVEGLRGDGCVKCPEFAKNCAELC